MTILLACLTAASLAVAFCAVAFARTVVDDARNARDQHARDRAGDRATIDMLCQRIQAPTLATAEHAAQGAEPDPPPIDLDDDEQMQEAREEREQSWQR